MPRGTETTEEILVTPDNYEPGENETPSETARNIAKLFEEQEEVSVRDQSGEGEESEPEAVENVEGDTTLKQPEQEAEKGAQKPERDESGKFTKKGQPQQKKHDPDLEPPAGLKAEAKKAFLNLPEGLRREYHRMIKGQQAHFTQTQQELKEKMARADGVMTTARNYITTNKMIDEEGRPYSEDRLVMELISAHHKIVTDPERTIAEMIQNTGANIDNIGDYLRGESPSGVDISKDPRFRAIQSELESVKRMIATQQTSEVSGRVAPIASEFEAVMREVDPASGEFRFPELHDEAFLESTKPIVQALRRNDSSLSWGDALKKAHSVLTGREYSPATPKTIAPASSNNLERARAAAVSVRGKIAPAGATVSIDDIPAGDLPQSATETARLMYKRLMGQ